MSPKVHSSGSEFSYRKFEKEDISCPTCIVSEEQRVRWRQTSEVQNRNTAADHEVMGAKEVEAIVSSTS